ncbi:MAG: hypothetical protein U0670_08970 [Anaerolineae bacterium]
MGIELYWDNEERTVMLCEVRGSWTWDDLFATLDKIKKVTDRSEQTIGAILDLTDGVTIPGGSIFNPTALGHAKKMLQMSGGQTGPLVIVGASPMIKTVFNTFKGLDRQVTQHVAFSATVDDARALLDGQMQRVKSA